MSEVEEMKLRIKVVMNKMKTKVLFAEAGSDFTDVLLSFLLLPLGTILNILEKPYGDDAPVIGSLNTLYNGVENLESIHFMSEAAKQQLLLPTSCYEDELRKLRLNISSAQPTVSDSGKSYDGVFTESSASYIISDDLQVMPIVAGSVMETLSTFGIDVADMDGAKTENVAFGLNNIKILLMISLLSSNPLTALLTSGMRMNLETVISEHGNALLHHQIDEKATDMNPKKMILKVMMQRSTSKFLFAQADHDFISFLFCVLTIPLGKVEWYLGSNSGLKNLDNLHQSIAADNNENMHLKSEEAKGLLMKSTLPTNYSSTTNEFSHLNFDPNEKQDHVKGTRMYMVTDDLTVTPLAITSCLSVLNGLKISLSDVKELELKVGLEEGLSILKAALTSTTALTDGLINPMLMKYQEMDQQKRNENGKTKRDEIETERGLHLVRMQIFTETMAGKIYTLEVMSSDTIDTVKEQIKDIECMPDVPLHELRLIFDGRRLQGGCRLADYDIQKGAILLLSYVVDGGVFL